MILLMVYSVALALVLGSAAARLEAAARSRGIQARGLWLAAMAASVAVGAWAFLRPAEKTASASGSWGDIPVTFLDGLPDAAHPLSWALVRADAVAGGLWIVATVVLAAWLSVGLTRLARRARRWVPARVADAHVLLSEDFGPAVLGVRAPRVVLPRWALEMEPERLRLVVLHEEEHRKAGDAALLLAGFAMVILAPWNVALWWHLHRLRAAVEVDCDARVLRRGAPADAYGRLLLQLGIREPGLPLPVAALSKPRSLLERRLTMIVRGERRGSVGRMAGALAVAALLVVVACETPMPTAIRPTEQVAEGEAAPVVAKSTFRAQEMLVEVAEAGPGDPVLIVDGVRVEDISALDPENIVRVEVVKGAAAEALMGPEGKAGVIRIVTRDAPADMLREAETANQSPVESRVIREVPEGEAVVVRRAGSATFQVKGVEGTSSVERREGTRILVDGKPYSGDLKDIDKDRIERIDVKGAAGEPATVYIVLKKEGGTR